MKKAERYVAHRLLSELTVLLVHVSHRLWRLANNADGSGLNDKERAALKKRLLIIEQVTKDLQRINEHIRFGLK